jgi:hypothetical protein
VVGFLSHVVCAFHLSSTLSVFFKPMTEDFGVTRGLFSLLRSGEIVLGAAMAQFVGPSVDRYGGRWLMAGGARRWLGIYSAEPGGDLLAISAHPLVFGDGGRRVYVLHGGHSDDLALVHQKTRAGNPHRQSGPGHF